MADVVTSVVYDGARNIQVKRTNVSDGTGESAVTLLDVSTLTPNPGVHIKLRRVKYTIHSGAVRLQWAATSPVDLVLLAEGTDTLDFRNEYAGGFPVPVVAGATGNILLTTLGFMANSGYTINLELIKGV